MIDFWNVFQKLSGPGLALHGLSSLQYTKTFAISVLFMVPWSNCIKMILSSQICLCVNILGKSLNCSGIEGFWDKCLEAWEHTDQSLNAGRWYILSSHSSHCARHGGQRQHRSCPLLEQFRDSGQVVGASADGSKTAQRLKMRCFILTFRISEIGLSPSGLIYSRLPLILSFPLGSSVLLPNISAGGS